MQETADGTGFEIVSATDYAPYGEYMQNSARPKESRYKFTEKERDAESSYDYFGARYYNNKLGVWLSVDPLAEKYKSWTPYHYVFNNPLKNVDLAGMDSTIYIRKSTFTKITDDELQQVGNQVSSVLSENKIPMKTKIISGFINLDPTDVIVEMANDQHPLIQKLQINTSTKNAEGATPAGSNTGIVTSDVMQRKGLTITGLGNITIHEALHGMGLDHDKNGESGTLIYKSGEGVTTREINDKHQKISEGQSNIIINEFLNRNSETK
jgi:RHS repeat-associated protein